MTLHLVRPDPDAAAEAAWDTHAANLELVRRVSVDPLANDRQRRTAIEMAVRSEVAFKRAFLAQQEIAI